MMKYVETKRVTWGIAEMLGWTSTSIKSLGVNPEDEYQTWEGETEGETGPLTCKFFELDRTGYLKLQQIASHKGAYVEIGEISEKSIVVTDGNALYFMEGGSFDGKKEEINSMILGLMLEDYSYFEEQDKNFFMNFSL